jgi:DNA-binding CsgD family transcriptional regulator
VRLAARLAEEYGQTWALAAAHQYVGYCHYFAGDWDSAVPALETAVGAAEETGFLKLLPAGLRLLAAIALDRGDLSAARRYLAHSDRLADQGVTHSSVRYPTELVRAELALAEGRTDDAVELLRSAPAWVEASTRDWILAHVAFRLAATGRRLGRDGLLDAANELLGAPPDGEAPRRVAFAAAALVDLDPELAARMAEAQREFLKPDYAELCEAAGLAFACVEQSDEAIRWYQQARDVWATARAGRRLAQVDAWLRDLGVRRRGRIDRGRPLSGWGSLTDAEVRVAELVAEGLLYREVADRLFLSRRTVETHVAHILRKLGMRNRAELAAAYARRHSEAPLTDR